jgi:hypothetical protein
VHTYRRLIPVLLAAVLLGMWARSATDGDLLPEPCPADARASTRPPAAPPDRADACRARAPRMVAAAGLPRPEPGYHHLGATTTGTWDGVQGRLTVRDPAVRRGSNDFVAARFMAKREAGGNVSWLEAGWAETGWSGGNRQRVYTFDTKHNAWAFYDQYKLRPGDQIWIYVQTDGGGAAPAWQAWLWWGDKWQLLAAESLPLTGRAQMEQYVEVHVDPSAKSAFAVPEILVDNVQVGGGFWREEQVPTAAGASTGTYCLNWRNRFDTWTAGSC